MEEELAVLDDELSKIIKEVEKEYAEVTKPKTKLKRNQRENKIEDMLEKIGTGKNTYSLYLSQLKELMKEADRKTYTEFKDKGHQHHKALNDLQQNVKLAKQNLAKEERLPGDKDKKDINTWGADEIIEEGKRVQEASATSLARSQRLVDAAEAIATDTNVALHEQTEKMKETNAEVEGVSVGLNRADKIVAHIARRLATDKMILCLVLLLIMAIVALVVCKGLGVLPGDAGADQAQIDCSLDFTQTNSECLAAREAEAGGRRSSVRAYNLGQVLAAGEVAGGHIRSGAAKHGHSMVEWRAGERGGRERVHGPAAGSADAFAPRLGQGRIRRAMVERATARMASRGLMWSGAVGGHAADLDVR